MLIININGRAEIKTYAQSRSLKERFSGWCGSVAARAYLPLTLGGCTLQCFSAAIRKPISLCRASGPLAVLWRSWWSFINGGDRSSVQERTIALPLTSSNDTKGLCSVLEVTLWKTTLKYHCFLFQSQWQTYLGHLNPHPTSRGD